MKGWPYRQRAEMQSPVMNDFSKPGFEIFSFGNSGTALSRTPASKAFLESSRSSCGATALRLLAGKLVELEVVDSIGHECVRQTLKKTA